MVGSIRGQDKEPMEYEESENLTESERLQRVRISIHSFEKWLD